MADAEEPAMEEQHKFLDLAKQFEWEEVKRIVNANPSMASVQPCGPDGTKRWSALHQAAFNGNVDAAQFLLDRKADVNATTNNGKTPLQVAKGSAKKFFKDLTGGEGDAAEEEDEAEENDEDEDEDEDEDVDVEEKEDEEEKAEEAAEEAAKEKEDEEVAEPKPKKAKKAPKKDVAGLGLNLNLFLKKHAETSSLKELVDQPISILKGLGEQGCKALNHRGVKTIRDLANWKFYRISRSIVILRGAEETGATAPTTSMNINKALDKEWETRSIDDIVMAPVSALQGLTPKDDEHFSKVHVKTIADLGTWKFARWAEAICDLAPFEEAPKA